jgi:hypothetical protein
MKFHSIRMRDWKNHKIGFWSSNNIGVEGHLPSVRLVGENKEFSLGHTIHFTENDAHLLFLEKGL